jgi:hypothetical protein
VVRRLGLGGLSTILSTESVGGLYGTAHVHYRRHPRRGLQYPTSPFTQQADIPVDRVATHCEPEESPPAASVSFSPLEPANGKGSIYAAAAIMKRAACKEKLMTDRTRPIAIRAADAGFRGLPSGFPADLAARAYDRPHQAPTR